MVKLIAECAQGSEGSLSLAKELIRLASHAKADIVKFQMVIAHELCTENYKYNDLFKSLEFEYNEYVELADLSINLDIELCFDIFGLESLEICKNLGLNSVKIHPTDLNNIVLLEALNASNIDTVFLGIGGAVIEEVDRALLYLSNKEVVLMLGYQSYPTPLEDNAIVKLSLLKKHYHNEGDYKTGFADHEPSSSEFAVLLPAMAVALGANYIEKHFTTNKLLKLEDSETAINPDEFLAFKETLDMAAVVRGEEKSGFELSDSEVKYRHFVRRHVVASTSLSKDKVLKLSDLKLLRTSESNPIHDLAQCLGKKLIVDIQANEAITKEMLK